MTTLDFWSEKATKELVGKKIVGARYLSKKEMTALGWTKSVLIMELDDGTLLFPSMDDEGNDGGALFGQGPNKEEVTYPVVADYLMGRQRPAPAVPPVTTSSSHVSQPSQAKWEDPRKKETLKKMLKRLQQGDSVHYLCEPTLQELEKEGYILKMEKRKVPGHRAPYFFVELSEKGKAA